MNGKVYQRKCINKACKVKFTPMSGTQVVCSPLCGVAYAKSMRLKQVKKLAQDWNKEKKIRKEKLKTLGDYEKEARKVYQKYIRLRDSKESCISCGCTTASQWDAGHYFKAELLTGYIFEEPLCNKQCSRCNDLYSGNEIQYRIGLVKKIGEEAVKAYEANMNNARFYKFTKEELIAKKQHYKDRIKELEIKSKL